jgi:uncharacterized protein (DUF1697 family)
VTTYLALLRAINVGGRNTVAMSDLRGLPEKLGFTDARTLMQTGNLVFSGSARPSAALERELEAAAKKRLRLETDFLVRTDKEWERLVGANPFPAEAKDDPSHLVVMFLKDAPGAGAVEALQAAIVGREVVRAVGKQAYLVYPDGIGRSKLTYCSCRASTSGADGSSSGCRRQSWPCTPCTRRRSATSTSST